MSKELEVQYKSILDLIPYANNTRTHSEEQVLQVVESIQQFSFTNPILIDGDNNIIAGHGRYLAAQKLGMTDVPTIELSHLSDDQRRAYIIADNKLAENSGWDEELLKLELGALRDADFNMDVIGFDEKELEKLLAKDLQQGLTDEDETPPVESDPVSHTGDVWVLGSHRIMCGSSVLKDDVEKLLNGVSPHLMVTDPPYGVDYDPSWRADAGINKNKEKMGVVENDGRADWTDAWDLFPGFVVYVWHAGKHASEVQVSLESANFEIRSQIIWAKDRLALSRGHYHWQHEPCWYAVRKGSQAAWGGGSETDHALEHQVARRQRPWSWNPKAGGVHASAY